jgi:hypothetical protein
MFHEQNYVCRNTGYVILISFTGPRVKFRSYWVQYMNFKQINQNAIHTNLFNFKSLIENGLRIEFVV